MKKILLIEDDANLAFMLTDGLESEGFEVLQLSKGEEVIGALKKFQPDMLLLDVNLKGVMNGFEVSKKIRQISQVPIIFTTSRTQIEDIQEGFQAGNVDYLKKPFGIRELILRINELLSRPANRAPIIQPINIGDLLFLTSEHCLQIGHDRIHLQKNECAVLNLLFENEGKVLSKKYILEHVWGDTDLKAKEASLHNILSSLRTKLSADSKVCIETIQKSGYKLVIGS